MNSTLKISGLHCESCKKLIESVASDVSGISSCVVNPDSASASVEHDTPEALEDLLREIKGIGEYQAEVI